MFEIIHGGDIYRNQVQMDYSVNTNPLGISNKVKEALLAAVKECAYYPDIHAEKLMHLLSEKFQIAQKQIICGNGASELFLAIVHALKPKMILIPVPSFYGYEKVSQASGAEVIYYPMKEEHGFALNEYFMEELSDAVDMIMLANPNNPVGNTLDPSFVQQICKKGMELGITVVIDECFLEFTKQAGMSASKIIDAYPNLIVVRAFTKIYAIPGVRLGYLFCSDLEKNHKIRMQLPEWNLSTFAQKAGIAALQEEEYVNLTRAYVREQRDYLTQKLQQLGLEVWPSDTNFILFKSEKELFERLLEQRILIRDCSNYRGLKNGFYRIAVKSREDNEKLIGKLGELLGTD